MNPWRGTLSGLAAILIGIGLARFAYTPLIPALIEGGWFTASEAAYLGAANLAGYLVGALAAGRLAAATSPATALRAMMLLATATFVASAFPLSFAWFFLWRFASGLAGGALMALAAPTVLPHVEAKRRGLAGGVIFTGVGLGIAASGTLVPPLLRLGLAETWFGLGAIALVLTALAWGGWPEARSAPSAAPGPHRRFGARVKALYASYGLNAVGLVPHMVFLVDFVARGLGEGLDVGARYWIVFGIGAIVGPTLFGAIADRIGFRAAVRSAFVVQTAAVALAALTAAPAALVVSSLVAGAFVPGIVPLVLGRLHELVADDPATQRAAWGYGTAAFALGQAAAAYAFSYLFAETGGYALLFALGAGAFVLALAIDVVVGAVARADDPR